MQSKNLQENQLRILIRKEISKIIKERQDEIPNKEKDADQETSKEEEPKEDRSAILKKITGLYLRSLRANLGELSTDEVVDAIDMLMTDLNFGKENKIQVIRGLRSRIQS